MKRSFVAGLLVCVIGFSATQGHAAVVFTDDFSGSPVLLDSNFVVFGGDATDTSHRTIGYGEYSGPALNGNLTIVNGGLNVGSFESNQRSITYILDPALFTPGAGDYRIDFDVAGFIAGTAGSMDGSFTLASLSNVNLDNTTNRARIIAASTTGAGASLGFTARNGASFINLVEEDINADGSLSFDFAYDGTSAVGLLFGAAGGTQYQLDNLVVQSVVAIPEPSSMALLGLLGCSAIYRRRRRSK